MWPVPGAPGRAALQPGLGGRKRGCPLLSVHLSTEFPSSPARSGPGDDLLLAGVRLECLHSVPTFTGGSVLLALLRGHILSRSG